MSDSEAPVRTRLLVVDDDAAIRRVVQDRFAALGYEVRSAKDGDQALSVIDEFEPALVILDLRMPGKDGFAVLEVLSERATMPEVVVVTAHGTIDSAVRAVKMGAADFVTKPFEPAQLQHVVERALSSRLLRRRVERLETELSSRHTLVTGTSGAMASILRVTERAASARSTILLLGESGSGKEVLARFVHAKSKRADGPFVAVNCATLGADLLESELFGHEKGAFTGAVKSKPGKLEQAEGGTLFLDEIAELPLATQAKLLRVLQEREYERVGGTRTLEANVRVVAATHRDLPRAIKEGAFREDLFYRINVVSVRVPPLRERPEDLAPLLEHFLARHAQEAGRPPLRLSDEARELLMEYRWPGNVRELSNVLERVVVLAEGPEVSADDLPEEIREQESPARSVRLGAAVPTSDELLGFHDAVREAKRRVLRGALARTGGHQTKAAQLLGLTQPYMARLMKNLDVKVS